MSTVTLTREVELTTIECSCGVVYALSNTFIEGRRGNHKTFWCPNGCPRHYPSKSPLELAQEEAANLRAYAERLKSDASNCRAAAESARKTAHAHAMNAAKARKGLKRITDRVSKGVCPCCNRTFANVARHMKSKHPNEAIEQADA